MKAMILNRVRGGCPHHARRVVPDDQGWFSLSAVTVQQTTVCVRWGEKSQNVCGNWTRMSGRCFYYSLEDMPCPPGTRPAVTVGVRRDFACCCEAGVRRYCACRHRASTRRGQSALWDCQGSRANTRRSHDGEWPMGSWFVLGRLLDASPSQNGVQVDEGGSLGLCQV